ncbi:hypothetical protein CHUAL_001511 [Chamberlinius hualienensis]
MFGVNRSPNKKTTEFCLDNNQTTTQHRERATSISSMDTLDMEPTAKARKWVERLPLKRTMKFKAIKMEIEATRSLLEGKISTVKNDTKALDNHMGVLSGTLEKTNSTLDML